MTGAFWMISRDQGVKGLTAISINAILVAALGLGLFVATPNFWIACPVVALIGFAFIVQNIANQTLIQMSSAPAMRKRPRSGPATTALFPSGRTQSVAGR